MCERECRDRVPSWHQDEQGHPEVEKRRQRSEGIADVRVIATGFGDHRTCMDTERSFISFITQMLIWQILEIKENYKKSDNENHLVSTFRATNYISLKEE